MPEDLRGVLPVRRPRLLLIITGVCRTVFTGKPLREDSVLQELKYTIHCGKILAEACCMKETAYRKLLA